MVAGYFSKRKRRAPMRRRKKAYRKRKSYGRKKYSAPDGYHSEKIIYNQNLVRPQDPAATYSTFYFTWLKALQYAGSYGVNQSMAGAGNTDKQFMQCATMYREYKVTGVALKYSPRYTIGQRWTLGSIKVGSKQYTSDEVIVPSPADIEGAFDSKMYNPLTPFKRFYNIGKWAKSKDIGWQTCEDILSVPPENIPEFDMVTGLIMEMDQTIAAGSKLGDLQIIYYVKFRGRTSSVYEGDF